VSQFVQAYHGSTSLAMASMEGTAGGVDALAEERKRLDEEWARLAEERQKFQKEREEWEREREELGIE
jgi:hypothetical protein